MTVYVPSARCLLIVGVVAAEIGLAEVGFGEVGLAVVEVACFASLLSLTS